MHVLCACVHVLYVCVHECIICTVHPYTCISVDDIYCSSMQQTLAMLGIKLQYGEVVCGDLVCQIPRRISTLQLWSVMRRLWPRRHKSWHLTCLSVAL